MRGAALLIAVAACGGGASSTTTTPPPPDDSEGDPAANAACPSNDVLVEDLRTLQSTTPLQPHVSIDDCTPGTFSRAGFVVAARTLSEEMDAAAFLFVVDADHAMIASTPATPIDPRSDAAPVELSVADLDGDGEDEVLEVSYHSEGGIDEGWLTVWAVIDDAFVRISELNLLYDEPGVVRCESSFTLQPPGLVLFTEIDGDPGEMCEDPGEARFRLDGALTRQR